MEEIKIIMSVVATILGMVATILTTIIGLLKTKNERIKNMLVITKKLQEFIIEAEGISFDGMYKLEYVIKRTKEYMETNNIEISNEDLIEKIEGLLEMTNKVNVRKEEKNEENEF